MASSKAVEHNAEAEEKKKALAARMAECTKLIESIRTQNPPDAERTKARLEEIIKLTPNLPLEYKRKALTDARTYQCNANLRAADTALASALDKARKDDNGERNRLVGLARNFCNKAISLGAATHIRAAINHKIEIIMLTGGVKQKGPTVAKPADTAPSALGKRA